jgi:hypothetical protein
MYFKGAVHLIELPVPMDEERKKKVARRNATAVAVMKV